MARSSFRRFLLVGGALAAAAAGAYVKRERMRELLPGGSSPEPVQPARPARASRTTTRPGRPPTPPRRSPAPDAVVTPDAGAHPTRSRSRRSRPTTRRRSRPPSTPPPPTPLADGIRAADDPGQQGAPEPIDEEAEEQAAAAEAAAIGGSPGPDYAGSEPDEPITEAERPLAEAGEGESEGQEQAEAELEENATVGDGVSDAERQIDETIEAASNPAVGETPEGPTADGGPRSPTTTSPAATGRPGREAPSSRSSGSLSRRKTNAGLKGDSRRSDAVVAGPSDGPVRPLHARDRIKERHRCPASSVFSSCWPAPAP